MNKAILIGRLTRDAQTRYTDGDEPMAVSRFTLAVDRKTKREEGQQTADFISCVAFGKIGQFIEKYGQQGVKLAIEGRIQTGSYTNRDGQRVYTTDIVVESAEFAESKQAAESNNAGQKKESAAAENSGFMPIEASADPLPFS